MLHERDQRPFEHFSAVIPEQASESSPGPHRWHGPAASWRQSDEAVESLCQVLWC
jgi:hypothetical protein